MSDVILPPDSWTVYRLTCQISEKAYIGITRLHPRKRWAQHQAHALRENRQSAIGAAIRKYGPETFVLEVLCEGVDEEEAAALERGLIAAFKTLTPNGYNLTSGGEYRKVLSEESRAKISRAAKGRKMSAEFRAKVSARFKGKSRIFSPQHLERVRAARRTPEARARMRNVALAHWTTGRWGARRAARPKVAKVKLGYHTEKFLKATRANQIIATAAAAIANRGRKRPPEVVAKILAFHRGRKRSAETRAKLSETARKRRIATCHNGHPYVEGSFFLDRRGHRKCRICLAAKAKREATKRQTPIFDERQGFFNGMGNAERNTSGLKPWEDFFLPVQHPRATANSSTNPGFRQPSLPTL